jgi:GNAT superfamily N-acetyltransferase
MMVVNESANCCTASYWTEDLSIRGTAEASMLENVWWVNRVVVNPPSARGHGLGSQLIEALKAAVLKMGGKELMVCPGGYAGNVNKQKRFYKHHGFKLIGSGVMRAKLD